jgi:hypothetical protein
VTPEDPAVHDAARGDDRRGRRELVRIGARALTSWTGAVIPFRRRAAAAVLGVVIAVAGSLLLARVLTEGGPLLATAYGAILGALTAGAMTSTWLARAARRIAMTPRGPLAWRDQSLLDRSVDRHGCVTIEPGTAERVAIESRRALAAHALGLPAIVLMLVAWAIGYPVMLVSGTTVPSLVFLPLWAAAMASALWTQSLAAGRMALLRDAADAELALPGSERAPAPPADPPHGSRLP